MVSSHAGEDVEVSDAQLRARFPPTAEGRIRLTHERQRDPPREVRSYAGIGTYLREREEFVAQMRESCADGHQ